MQKGCEKCEYTGFAYGTIPCMCTEGKKEKHPLTGIFQDPNLQPMQGNYDPNIDIDNQFKPDPDGEGGYGCLNLTFPAQDRDFQIMKVSGKGQIINIGEPVFYGPDSIFVGRTMRSAIAGGWVEVIVDGTTYNVDSNDPMLQFGKPAIERCPTCGNKKAGV